MATSWPCKKRTITVRAKLLQEMISLSSVVQVRGGCCRRVLWALRDEKFPLQQLTFRPVISDLAAARPATVVRHA